MINLLPEQEKKEIHKEYLTRRRIVILVTLLFFLAMVATLFVPTYTLSMYKRYAAESSRATPETDIEMDYAALTKKVEYTKELARVLKPDVHTDTPSKLIDILFAHKNQNITITNMSYTYSAAEDSGSQVVVKGIARTRQDLRTYTDNLKKDPVLTAVNISVSNFAQESNINFEFSIVAKK